ncbi:MAG: ATPase [Clostridia bacterium]|nr:ATPase [Clostridia bacterium]
MAIEKMKLVRTTGPMEQLNNFSTRAAGSGVYHPEPALEYLSASLGYSAVGGENDIAPLIESVQEVAHLGGLKLERLESDSALQQFDDETLQEYLTGLKNRIEQDSVKRKALLDQKQECEDYIDKLSHFTGLDVRIDDLLSCEFLVVRFGSIPKDCYPKLSAYENNPYLLFTPCSSDDLHYWGVYCAPREKIDDIDAIFASLYFEQLVVNNAWGTVEEIIATIQENVSILKQQIEQIDMDLTRLAEDNSERLNELYTRLCLKNESFAMRRYAAQHNSEFYCVGWVPADQAERFSQYVSGLEGVSIDVSAPNKTDKHVPPTKLKNFFLFRPFEYYVEMYGLPEYDSLDITAFVAVTYTVIFGMMFGDLGQGFVLMLAGILMWKLKKMALGKILIPCGVSSMCFGLVFGSCFGYEHLLDPLYHAVGLREKPLEVMDSINTVLLFAIAIGVGLVAVSMLLNVVSNLRAKKYGEALFSNNGVAGILLYLTLVNLAVAFMNGPRVLPNAVCLPIIIVCAVILLFKEVLIALLDHEPERMPESVSDFLLQNVFEMLEYVLSYFSNTVSFLRVGAFVLVHAGMMMVVFSLAGESENIVVILLGNVLVIALEGLLTGIQALRLEFYEMFSRCFEGNGKPFRTIANQ